MRAQTENASQVTQENRRETGSFRPGDGQLLEAYLVRRDESAFEAMVARHGPRVLGVCRQVLGRSAEVDDAFQSTFLLLATKAGSIRNPESLGSWLHGVAHRISIRSKARAARRMAQEREATPAIGTSGEDDMDLPQIQLVLHSEVDRLPERFRRPILLCYLEGRTNEEAARLIGCPAGTLKDRLTRAREILRGRLARRGISLTVALLLLILPGTVTAEEVPPWLVAATIEAAKGKMGTNRRIRPASAGIRVTHVVPVAAVSTVLVMSTIVWVLSQPSPERGTWLRWLLNLIHKVCR